jgi:hypothetical protein
MRWSPTGSDTQNDCRRYIPRHPEGSSVQLVIFHTSIAALWTESAKTDLPKCRLGLTNQEAAQQPRHRNDEAESKHHSPLRATTPGDDCSIARLRVPIDSPIAVEPARGASVCSGEL